MKSANWTKAMVVATSNTSRRTCTHGTLGPTPGSAELRPGRRPVTAPATKMIPASSGNPSQPATPRRRHELGTPSMPLAVQGSHGEPDDDGRMTPLTGHEPSTTIADTTDSHSPITA